MSGVSERNPFVGPRPIQEGEALYGRKSEIRGLYDQLQARRIVVLHAPSGAGKSSLVQAGLVPRLKAGKFDVWKAIRINLDPAGFEGLPDHVNRYLLSALVNLEDELPAERRRSPKQLAELDFLAYLESRPRRRSMLKRPVVLLFDQFEEILTVDPRAVEAKQEFFEAVGRALNVEKYWALFIVREDYLAALTPYREYIPTQMSNTCRIDLLGLEGARAAALNLAAEGGREFPGVDKLVRDLSMVQVQQADGTFVAEQGPFVEPVHLQVVCHRLWEAMPADDLSIDDDDIDAYAMVSRSLGAYYGDMVRMIANNDTSIERSIRDWIVSRIIVGGVRSQVRQETAITAGLDNELISQLLNCYLIRAEQRAGANWFELSHDRLVGPILEENRAWEQANLHPLQVQAKVWEDQGRTRSQLLGGEALASAVTWARANPSLLTPGEREFLKLSLGLRAERLRARRLRRGFTMVLAAVAIIAVMLGGVAWQMRGEAEQERAEAVVAREQAIAAQHSAEQAQLFALSALGEAEQARQHAVVAEQQNQRLARDVLRQMFQVALEGFIGSLAADGTISGEVEVDERWTPLLEHTGQRFAAANVVDGGGRLVVAGHEAVLSSLDARGDSLFVEITVQWLLGDHARRGVIILSQRPGGYERLELLQRSLSALGYDYEIDTPIDDLEHDERTGVLIIDNRWSREFTAAEVAAVKAFVEGGGGVLAVGAGWSWLNREPAEGEPQPTLDNYPMNAILRDFGVRWGAATIDAAELERTDPQATVRFENRRAGAVIVYSRTGQGREEFYTTLELGEDLEILTTRSRVWVIRDKQDEHVIGEVEIWAAHQLVSIGETVASTQVKPRAKAHANIEPEPEPEQLPNTLSNAQMSAAWHAAKTASLACGKLHGSLIPSAKVQLVVAPDGKVTSASVLAPMTGTKVGNCVAKGVSAQKFPQSKQGVSRTWTLPL